MKGADGLQKVLYAIMIGLGIYILYKGGGLLLETPAVQSVLDSGEAQRMLEDSAARTWTPGYTASVENRGGSWLAGWMQQVAPVYSYVADGRGEAEIDGDAGEPVRETAGEGTAGNLAGATEKSADGEATGALLGDDGTGKTTGGQIVKNAAGNTEEAPEQSTDGNAAGMQDRQDENAPEQMTGEGLQIEQEADAERTADESGSGTGSLQETDQNEADTDQASVNGASADEVEILDETAKANETVMENEDAATNEASANETEATNEALAMNEGAAANETAAANEAAINEPSTPASSAAISPALREQLRDFDYLVSHYFTVDGGTVADEALLDADALLDENLTLEKNPAVPQILIYHTHSQEAFADSREGEVSDTIVGMGEALAGILREQYGYNVIHDTGVYDLVDGVLDRSASYDYARAAVQQILEEHPTIEVVIDLHRDGVDGQKFVTEIDGRPTSMIMFFNGISRDSYDQPITYLQNPYTKQNLAFSLQLQLAAEAKYPGFTRNIYLKAERFNLHLRPRSLLIEAGTQLNTVEEEQNAMTPLADLLAQVLSGNAEE